MLCCFQRITENLLHPDGVCERKEEPRGLPVVVTSDWIRRGPSQKNHRHQGYHCVHDTVSNRTSTAIHTPSAQHDKQDKPAGMCTTPYRESRRTAATLQTVRHSSFGGEGAPTRPSRPSRPSRPFTGKRGLGQKNQNAAHASIRSPHLPSLPFNMIFSFR